MKKPQLHFLLDESARFESRIALEPPEVLAQNLLSNGIETFGLNWAGVFSVELFVEDDIQFLAESYLDVEGDKWQEVGACHEIFLGDGLLHVRSAIAGEKVDMEMMYVPYLNKAFLETGRLLVDRERYLFAWRGLAEQLGALCANNIV